MRPDWRVLSLLLALFGLWAFAALAPGCDGKPRPAELIPAQPGGAHERSLAKARTADAVRSGRLTLLEGAEAFRRIDRDNPDAPALDLDAYCREVIRWVRGPDADDKIRPDLADLLDAERAELRREGLLRPPRRGRSSLGR
jgi:hypothetical protein